MRYYLIQAELNYTEWKWFLVKAFSVNSANDMIRDFTGKNVGITFYLPIEGRDVVNNFDYWDKRVVPLTEGSPF